MQRQSGSRTLFCRPIDGSPRHPVIYQIDADERQLREAIELVPAGAEAEFHVTVEDQGRTSGWSDIDAGLPAG